MKIAYCVVCGQWTEHESHQGQAGYLCLHCFNRHEPDNVIENDRITVNNGVILVNC